MPDMKEKTLISTKHEGLASWSLPVYVIFFVSGATALVYQILWSRWLSLIIGNTTLSVSVILACFMLGLALGSWLGGRFLSRVGNPMQAYAAAEFGIGLFALCFPFLSDLIDAVYPLLVTTSSTTGYSLLVRAVMVFLLLSVPTTLMGATLPFLTDFFHRSPRHTRNWKVGLLYAANTFGAAAGTVAASFLLIELIGVARTTLLAALLNLSIGIAALAISRRASLRRRPAETGHAPTLPFPGRFAIWLLTATGALALASEVLWTRTLETMVGNSTYAFATIVLLYLIGIALGSWVASLLVKRVGHLSVWLAAAALLMGAWTIASVHLITGLLAGLAQQSGQLVPLSFIFGMYFKTFSILIPLSVLSGACFPIATRLIDPRSEDAKGRLIARAYGWNTVGAVAGSLTAGFVIAPHSDYFQSLYVLALTYCLVAVGACAILLLRAEGSRRVAAAVLLVIALPPAAFSLLRTGDESIFVQRHRERHALGAPKVLYHEPGLQGVVSVLQWGVSRQNMALLVNGHGMTIKRR